MSLLSHAYLTIFSKLCLESSNQSGTPKHAMAHSTAPTGQLGPPAASTPAPGSLRDAAVASDAAVVEDVEASYSSFLAVQMPEIVSPKISSRRRERQPVVDDDGVCFLPQSDYNQMTPPAQFRRYHQSDLLLRGLSRTRERWWAGTAQAEVDGQSVIVKRYEGPREGALEVRTIPSFGILHTHHQEAMEGRRGGSAAL